LDTAPRRGILSSMSTVAEILEAVRHLEPQQKQELVEQLESVLIEPGAERPARGSQDYGSPEFTARLIEHFHRAKRAALGQS
jgi:hypothetical protein